MKLPNNEVGISDIINYRRCPQNFAWGMRRHVPLPERFALFPGEKTDPPGNETYASAYGHMTHDAIEIIEQTHCSDEEAIDAVWPIYQHFMEPGDIQRIRDDLATWRTRRFTGWKLVGTELELKVPLFVRDGQLISFRCRIDALYQHIENPHLFMTRDWKSSRYPKTEKEVHEDLQQWSYNLAVHENFPECTDLTQLYDQLRHGPPIPTSKTPAQRREIKDWLIKQVKAILDDDTLKPVQNDMCHFCPIMNDCRETHRAPDWWINRLAALAPERKEGRKIVVQLTEEHTGFEVYAELLPRAKQALKVLERFVKAVEEVMKEMPDERRRELGFDLTKPRRTDKFSPDAMREIQRTVGPEAFLQLVSLTKTKIEEMYGPEKDSETTRELLALAEASYGNPSLKYPRAA
jgi:PD-(D/E)XK nuclease superfamily